jgi:hypothetical protein
MTLPGYGPDEHPLALTLTRLLLTERGRLLLNPYRNMVARAALLIDWAQAGRLVDGAVSIELDTRPSGDRGADALLTAIEGKPDRPLQYWLTARVTVIPQLAQQLCDRGIWEPAPSPLWRRFSSAGYRDRRAAELAPLRLQLAAIGQDGKAADPQLIALAMLAQLVVEPPTLIRAELINEYHCRQLSWIIRLVRDYFEDRLPRLALSAFLGTNESGAG